MEEEDPGAPPSPAAAKRSRSPAEPSAIPAPAPFPLPWRDDFSAYAEDTTPVRGWADQQGSWAARGGAFAHWAARDGRVATLAARPGSGTAMDGSKTVHAATLFEPRAAAPMALASVRTSGMLSIWYTFEATVWYVLPSLPMFLLIPALLRRGIGFWPALTAGCLLTIGLYALMTWIGPRFGLKL
jgi:hypothetical protein